MRTRWRLPNGRLTGSAPTKATVPSSATAKVRVIVRRMPRLERRRVRASGDQARQHQRDELDTLPGSLEEEVDGVRGMVEPQQLALLERADAPCGPDMRRRAQRLHHLAPRGREAQPAR